MDGATEQSCNRVNKYLSWNITGKSISSPSTHCQLLSTQCDPVLSAVVVVLLPVVFSISWAYISYDWPKVWLRCRWLLLSLHG